MRKRKWNLMLGMEVSTLDASNIKVTGKFASQFGLGLMSSLFDSESENSSLSAKITDLHFPMEQ